MRPPPRTITVDMDTAEKLGHRLLFPATIKWYPDRNEESGRLITLKVHRHRLDAGDYAIKGFHNVVIVEAKRSIGEITTNLLTADFRRARQAFQRLIESTEHPYLLLDMSPAEAFRTSAYAENPQLAFDHLSFLMADLGLGLIWAGPCRSDATRRRLGEQIVRLMLAHCLRDRRISYVDGLR